MQNSVFQWHIRYFRGTTVYMAPEILVETSRLKSACFEDLKKIDIWAFGMVIFNLTNPDLTCPYQLDLVDDELEVQDQVQDFLLRGILPSDSPKYKKSRETTWLSILRIKEKCTEFDPSERPTAIEIGNELQALVCNVNTENVKETSIDEARYT